MRERLNGRRFKAYNEGRWIRKGRIMRIKLVAEKSWIPQLHRSSFPLHFFLPFRFGRQRYIDVGGNRSVSIVLMADKSHLMRLMNEQIPHSHSGGGVCI